MQTKYGLFSMRRTFLIRVVSRATNYCLLLIVYHHRYREIKENEKLHIVFVVIVRILLLELTGKAIEGILKNALLASRKYKRYLLISRNIFEKIKTTITVLS